MSEETLVRLTDVTVAYHRRKGLFQRTPSAPVVAVDDVSLELVRGRTLGVVGGTGAGKSTVARLIMGMAAPTSGTVEVLGHDLATVDPVTRGTIQRRRQVVLQDPFSSLDGRMRVRDIIAEPMTLGRRPRGSAARATLWERVEELMAMVGLPADRADAYPHQFSGGQRQRISIARALSVDPELVVLDEPTSALDVSVRAQILNLLRDLQRRLGLTYLVISHDLATVGYLSSSVAVMRQGRIVEQGPTRALFGDPAHPYTVRLLASIPGQTATFLEQPRVAEGEAVRIPDMGCPYAPSCALRPFLGSPEECTASAPRLRALGPDRHVECHFGERVAGFVQENHPDLVPSRPSAAP